jgi:nitroreductase
MPLADLLQRRRSIKRFTDRPVTRAEIETLLAAAVLAPNHRLTEPWRFYVLGPEAREAYGRALGVRKAKKIEDPEASRTMRERVAAEHRALPCMIAVAVVKSDNQEISDEDYAATMMGVQNMMLAAVELGLGTAIRTGGVMGDDAARAAAGVAENERIIAIVNVGEPAETPAGAEEDAGDGVHSMGGVATEGTAVLCTQYD